MRRTLSLLGGALIGLALGQFPEYAQQYTQRLGGAVDELRIITADFDRAASEAGLSRQQALARFTATGDDFVGGRGRSMEATFRRYETLSATLARIETADPWTRVTLLPAFLDTDIGQRTLSAYKPALPVTAEGLAWAGAGLGLGYLVFSGLIRFCMLPFSRRHRRRYREAD
ncbi:Protein of unknown function [Devosia enhydra]|uniref:DUF2937 family protein n=1 Tax=Devosia enhydra TaxID=665118 RepID=A0A1K2I2B1_9HYPH|nr:DUF2937 family protein [Devosia enhydra]SFZ86526.1 Protein of unknown function [Devosia enhydra]